MPKEDFKRKKSLQEKNTSWVKDRNSTGYCFFAKPVVINANIDTVWNLVKDVRRYDELSDGAVVAHVDGPLDKGTTIKLDLYPNTCKGKLIPQSEETISVVDSEHKVIGWERKLPLTSEPTERYQVLEAISAEQTRSCIGLRIRGGFGLFTQIFLKNTVEGSFTDLNEGIKKEAEKRSLII